MLSSNRYFLLAMLSLFVVFTICAEEKPRKADSASDAKKNAADQAKEDKRRKDKYMHYETDDDEVDDVDERLAALPVYADNRYSALGSPESKPRTRARWPSSQSPAPAPSSLSSSFDDFMNGFDWSRVEFPNAFPSSPSPLSHDTNPVLSSAASCHSLVDAQYPVFSDVCGAVPQARYSLPNTFGHRERWQVAQILSAVFNSASDSSCTRSLRLLVCPVLFPPCPTRHEPPTVLPCQSYCRAVKARCASPALDLISCEALPYSSDLCPTNQAYGSFTPPGAFPSMNQPSPVNDGFPSSNHPMSRSYSSLRSLLSSQGLQAPSPHQSGPSNFYNAGPQASESLTPLFVDFPPRSFNNDPRQTSRYSALTRSSSEARPTMDMRPQTDTQFATGSRPSAVSSVVKA